VRKLLLLVVIAGLVIAMMPPARITLPAAPAGLTNGPRGIIHIHTMRSDGTGTIGDVTRAAAAAGLNFVIVTDHGDGTRAPDTPDYMNGVLYIDAVEISTHEGHVVALGLPQSPYPLAGESRDVVEDINRMGGVAIAAHPGSPKVELQWTDWNAAIGGLEWLNADSEWRDEKPWTIGRALVAYPFRPTQALALLLDHPQPVLRTWDKLTSERQLVAVAGSDTHARIGARSVGEPYDTAGSLHFPSYTNSFREFSIVVPDVRLTGEATADARNVIKAIRAGDVYSTIDALAGPAAFRFEANSGSRHAPMGDVLPIGGGVMLRAAVQAPADAKITLLRDGTASAMATGNQLQFEAPAEPGVYRVEVSLPTDPGNPPVPWIVSNPIYVGRAAPPPPLVPPPANSVTSLYDGGPPRGWKIEKNPDSDAMMDVVGKLDGSQLLLRYALSGKTSESPYVAFVMPATADIASHRRLQFTARADRPMRVAVQLRGASAGARWRRSLYLDDMPRKIDVPFDEFRPQGNAAAPMPPLDEIQSVLFVVDTVNTKVGSNGQVWIDDVRYAR
jgi:hypothetical protein